MKLVREHINEKFEENSDPIRDLNIGLINKIKQWISTAGNESVNIGIDSVFKTYDFKKEQCQYSSLDPNNIIINDDLTIDVIGWVDISSGRYKELPEYIRFNHIHGDFACNFDTKKYLKFMPKQVDGEIRIYMSPYPDDENLVKEKIRKVCKVKKGIQVKWA